MVASAKFGSCVGRLFGHPACATRRCIPIGYSIRRWRSPAVKRMRGQLYRRADTGGGAARSSADHADGRGPNCHLTRCRHRAARQADAQAHAGAPLFPTLNFSQEAYSALQRQRPVHRRPRSGQLQPRSVRLMKSISGARTACRAAEETSTANRFDAMWSPDTLAVANAYFQVLARFGCARRAAILPAPRNSTPSGAPAGTGTDLDVAQQEVVLANQRALVPRCARRCAERHRAGHIGIAAAGKREDYRRLAGPDLPPRVTPGLPSELLTQADIAPGGAACARHSQFVKRARVVFSEHHLTGRAVIRVRRWRRCSAARRSLSAVGG